MMGVENFCVSGYEPGVRNWAGVVTATTAGENNQSPFLRNLGWLGESRANSLAHDRIFTGLQHPYPNHERVCIRRDALVGLLAGVRVQFNRRRPLAQSIDDLASGDASNRRVKAYEEMWNMVGDPRDDRLRPYRRYALHRTGY